MAVHMMDSAGSASMMPDFTFFSEDLVQTLRMQREDILILVKNQINLHHQELLDMFRNTQGTPHLCAERSQFTHISADNGTFDGQDIENNAMSFELQKGIENNAIPFELPKDIENNAISFEPPRSNKEYSELEASEDSNLRGKAISELQENHITTTQQTSSSHDPVGETRHGLGIHRRRLPSMQRRHLRHHRGKRSHNATDKVNKFKAFAMKHHARVLPHVENTHNYSSKRLRDLTHDNHAALSTAQSSFQRFVQGTLFESISTILTLCSVTVMACQVQYRGIQNGYTLGIPGYNRPAEQVWSGAAQVLEILELAFTGLLTLELCLRIAALQKAAFQKWFVLLDGAIVIAAWIDASGVNIYLHPLALRMIRLVRLARIFKVLKDLSIIDTLFLLIRSIRACIGVFIWTYGLLLLVQLAVALMMCQSLGQHMSSSSMPDNSKKEVFLFFGTFSNSLLTMFEIALANWSPAARVLTEHVSEWYVIFFLIYRCGVLFAMMSVITAVFVAETNRNLSNDDRVALATKHKQKQAFCVKLKELFDELDESGDGMLSREEFNTLVDDGFLRAWLSTLEVDTHDLNTLFSVLDRGAGEVDMMHFIDGLTRVKGGARSIDVLQIASSLHDVEIKMELLHQQLSRKDHLSGLESKTELLQEQISQRPCRPCTKKTVAQEDGRMYSI